ncbi:hypothetical protein B5S52_05415 [Pectobacterium brasiliense]|uniref:dCTP deaminase domain-containing protein n=1 Tax=Pectobacterium brasiliense TaxID=180957 RepID=UPI0009B15B59|nr:hypothetical protein [Pectobacterium brasiliense]ARA75352.1 hypothetical protein B5S52_05415 [Pectobacterium brasiliense]MBN3192195.1 hypothetical protein [Pectobacterium brasiliense]
MTLLCDQEYPNGMLTDNFIKKALPQLFCKNADESKAKYSTYELSLDAGYELIKYDDKGNIQRNEKEPTGKICANPGDTILVYSKEIFSLPNNVYARVNTVGQIFMAGFSAENTYVDPGFKGQISITLINNSNRTLTMDEGIPLARVEFIKLSDEPSITHQGRSGVRATKVKQSIDKELTSTFEKIELTDLFEEIKKSIAIDAIQKKSVRTDIALSRAYIKLVSDIDSINSLIKNQERKIKYWSWLASLGLGTASAFWIDKFGLTSIVVGWMSSDSNQPMWLVVIMNIACSIIATYLYEKILRKFIK